MARRSTVARRGLPDALRRPLRRLYQTIADSRISTSRSGAYGSAVSRVTRTVFGQRRIEPSGMTEILPELRVAVEIPWMTDFVQEGYKWPVKPVRTRFDGDGWFVQGAFRFGRVPGAMIAGDGRVFDRRGRFVVESAPSHLSRVINPGPLRPPVSRRIDGTVLNLNWWAGNGNIYHWNRDVLSRAFVLRHLVDEEIVLLLPLDAREHQRHAAAQLVSMFPSCRVDAIGEGEWVEVAECIVPTQAPYRLGSGYLHPEVASFVRDVNIAGVDTDGPPIGVAYVSRAKSLHRKIRNEHELVDRLRSEAGAEILELEDLGYREQMALLQRVGTLVGVYGEGLTHAYFTRGRGLVEVHNGNSRETHFATLAMSRGIPYAQVQGGECDRRQDFDLDARGRDEVLRAIAQLEAR